MIRLDDPQVTDFQRGVGLALWERGGSLMVISARGGVAFESGWSAEDAERVAQGCGGVAVDLRGEQNAPEGPSPKAPVCPRCLDIEPGTPASDMGDGKPPSGPFTANLCAQCRRAVNQAHAAERGWTADEREAYILEKW